MERNTVLHAGGAKRRAEHAHPQPTRNPQAAAALLPEPSQGPMLLMHHHKTCRLARGARANSTHALEPPPDSSSTAAECIYLAAMQGCCASLHICAGAARAWAS